MLREISNLRQIEGEPQRRWFEGQELELIIWQSGNEIIALSCTLAGIPPSCHELPTLVEANSGTRRM
jgi:hypothetical protein